MPRTAPQHLARSSRADLLEAHRRCRELLTAARTLAEACGHDPDVANCSEAGCQLAEVGDDGSLCALAQRLSLLAPVAPDPATTGDALARFATAVAASVEAVRTCRQTAHPSGACWFTSDPSGDGCAEVLRFAHDLG